MANTGTDLAKETTLQNLPQTSPDNKKPSDELKHNKKAAHNKSQTTKSNVHSTYLIFELRLEQCEVQDGSLATIQNIYRQYFSFPSLLSSPEPLKFNFLQKFFGKFHLKSDYKDYAPPAPVHNLSECYGLTNESSGGEVPLLRYLHQHLSEVCFVLNVDNSLKPLDKLSPLPEILICRFLDSSYLVIKEELFGMFTKKEAKFLDEPVLKLTSHASYDFTKAPNSISLENLRNFDWVYCTNPSTGNTARRVIIFDNNKVKYYDSLTQISHVIGYLLLDLLLAQSYIAAMQRLITVPVDEIKSDPISLYRDMLRFNLRYYFNNPVRQQRASFNFDLWPVISRAYRLQEINVEMKDKLSDLTLFLTESRRFNINYILTLITVGFTAIGLLLTYLLS